MDENPGKGPRKMSDDDWMDSKAENVIKNLWLFQDAPMESTAATVTKTVERTGAVSAADKQRRA